MKKTVNCVINFFNFSPKNELNNILNIVSKKCNITLTRTHDWLYKVITYTTFKIISTLIYKV